MAVPPLRTWSTPATTLRSASCAPTAAGARRKKTPSPVKVAATALGLDVTHDMNHLEGAGVELAVVVAYGRIIPARLLEQIPMVNLHFSLLPCSGARRRARHPRR